MHAEQFRKHQQSRAIEENIAENKQRIHAFGRASARQRQRRVVDAQPQEHAEANQCQGIARPHGMPVVCKTIQVRLRLRQKERRRQFADQAVAPGRQLQLAAMAQKERIFRAALNAAF